MRKKLHKIEAIAEKRGIPVYMSNPSVPQQGEITKPRRGHVGDEKRGIIIDETSGEILGRGGAVAYEWEEVDKERFVKLFLEGLRQAAGLSKAGLAVFEIVYNQMRKTPGQDTVVLSALTSGLKKTTYYNGLKELLEREFLYRSPYDGTFFVNIRYMFNGDRLAFVKAYHLKGANRQKELPFEETDTE